MEIANRAMQFDQTVLADLCRMAALEAADKDIPLGWDWVAAKANGTPEPSKDPSVTAIPYQVWSKRGTGSYSMLVPNAKAALAAVAELSSRGHFDTLIKDMDGNDVDPDVLQAIIEMEANPTIRLAPR